jgi:DNA-directed RNA polymerase subunit L
MEIKIIKETENELLVEIDESETFANMIREELWNVGVLEAAFIKEHPEMKTTKIWIKAEKPKEKLKKAVENLIGKLEKLKELYKTSI